MSQQQIPFHKAYISGKEEAYIKKAIETAHFSAEGPLAKQAQEWFKNYASNAGALLTTSCTTGLDMAALLCDIGPGDEVILPSYTFVSTASAVVLRGATPVFVDINPNTQNIDEHLIEAAITKKTKAIFPVHYASMSCNMDFVLELAQKYQLKVVEDSAQCIYSYYKGKLLGTLGDFGVISFHATKNIHCGEGGVLLVKNQQQILSAEIARDRGTNRTQFVRGEVDRYTWVGVGTAFGPNELSAGFLLGQIEMAESITKQKILNWEKYQKELKPLADRGLFQLPQIAKDCQHNGHIYYLLMKDSAQRTRFVHFLKEKGIGTAPHYVPLHQSPIGSQKGRVSGSMKNTDSTYQRLIRLPTWLGVEKHLDQIIETVFDWSKTE